MAETQAPRPYTIALPLFSGQHAFLMIPTPLTQRDYEHLRWVVDTMLEGSRDSLVKPDPLTGFEQPDPS